MPDLLTVAAFDGLQGEAFRLEAGPGTTAELTLAEVQRLPVHAHGARPPAREPFSLVFRGAAGAHWPQRTYEITHQALGRLEIFLVPIGPDEQGQRYEAVFN